MGETEKTPGERRSRDGSKGVPDPLGEPRVFKKECDEGRKRKSLGVKECDFASHIEDPINPEWGGGRGGSEGGERTEKKNPDCCPGGRSEKKTARAKLMAKEWVGKPFL